MVLLYTLAYTVRSYLFLREISIRIRWFRREYEEGSRPELEILTEQPERFLRRNVTITMSARWNDERRFTISSPVSVGREGVARISTDISLPRGHYNASSAKLVVPDPLGLTSAFRTVESPGALSLFSVVGEGINAPERVAVGGEDVRFNRSSERSDTLLETRPYVFGDNPQRISWNAYAHTGELHIRIGEEREHPHRNVTVVGDLRPPAPGASLECLDELLRTVLGTGRALEEKGYCVHWGWSNGVRIGSGNIEAVQRYTASITWDSREDLIRFRSRGTTMILVSVRDIDETGSC